MSAPESRGSDPYAAVLADLRAKRDQIDQAIRTLEAVAGDLSSIARAPASAAAPAATPAALLKENNQWGGDFLGMSIADATKKLLASQRRAMSNTEIASALQVGGLVMNSADPINTVGSVITRRFAQVGDIVKVGRGIWGLKEWYPNRSFKPTSPKDALSSNGDSTAPAPPSEPIGGDLLEEAIARERGPL